MLVYPKRQPSEAWRVGSGIPPTWADDCLKLNDAGELLLSRQSGNQLLNVGEWIVKDLDGGIAFYTNAEFERTFEHG